MERNHKNTILVFMLGVVVGAVAFFFSKKENRNAAKDAFKRGKSKIGGKVEDEKQILDEKKEAVKDLINTISGTPEA